MKNPGKFDYELGERGIPERPRYFPRQIITAEEMTLEQKYFRDKLRRHNRLLHGWGVVCGALVCPVCKPNGSGMEAWKVKVEPGYILGPYGDEIMIACEHVVDLRTSGITGITGEPSLGVADPWCSEVFEKPPEGPVFVAVRYKEIMARPVRVQPMGCGCDDTQCEYSRWQDGYEIGILTECPDSHKDPQFLDDYFRMIARGSLIPKCPPCPSEPWVVLARVEFDANGIITKIDNCSCRRMVISFDQFWWKCQVEVPVIGEVKPDLVKTGTTQELFIGGEKFKSDLQVSVGQGIQVVKPPKLNQEGTSFTAVIQVDDQAEVGPRTLTVMNPDCSIATLANAIRVKEKPSPKQAPSKEAS